MNHLKQHFIIFLIIVFAFVLRVININQIPVGLFVDEASIGYNAYTILKFGTDENGNKFPLLFQNFGDFYRPGISIYLTVVPVFILGLSEFSVRFTAILAGTATIYCVYRFVKILFNNNVGLISALLLAIAPWHIHFSRINQEFIYLTFFLSVSIWVFLEAIKKHNRVLLLTSAVLFGLSVYTYVTAYVFIPLFILLPLYIYFKEIKKIKHGFILFILVFILFLLPLFAGVKSGKTFSRFIQVSSINNQKSSQEILQKTVSTYIRHFSYQFLFEKGDIDEPGHFITRFSVRGMGQLYLFQLPFIILGLLFSYKINKKSFLVLVGLLLLYPLGSTLAPFADGGGPFAMRSITGVIPFQILTAVGIYGFYKLLKKDKKKIYIFLVLLTISIVFSCTQYLIRYHKEYSLYSSDFWGWQYGPKPVMKYIISQNLFYDELILFGDFNAPATLLKFYDPENYCKNKCILGDYSTISKNKRQLFAIQVNKLTPPFLDSFNVQKIIFYPNHKPAFYIGEFSQK